MAGVAILTAAFVLLVPLDEGWQPLDVAWRLAAVGVGFGLFVTPVQTLAMTLSPPALLGVTAATTNLARQLGLALGPALATAVWAASGYALSGMRAALALAVTASAVALVAVRRGPVSMSINHQGDDDVTEDRRDLLLIDRQRARPGTGGR